MHSMIPICNGVSMCFYLGVCICVRESKSVYLCIHEASLRRHKFGCPVGQPPPSVNIRQYGSALGKVWSLQSVWWKRQSTRSRSRKRTKLQQHIFVRPLETFSGTRWSMKNSHGNRSSVLGGLFPLGTLPSRHHSCLECVCAVTAVRLTKMYGQGNIMVYKYNL